MPRILATTALAALLPAAAFAMSEEVVTIANADGQEFVGTLALADDGPAPVVLMLHGFTGARDELKTEAVPSGVFARTAKALAENGFSSLRIDFRGSGESLADLSFADTTFEGQVNDALAAVAWLENRDDVDASDMYLIGWSQGGLVATAAAGRSGDRFDAVALWAAPADPEGTFGTLIDAETLEKGLALTGDQAVSLTLPWGAEIALKGGFFQDLVTFEPTEEIAAYDGPLLVAQGTEDTTVPPANADMLIDAHDDGPEQLWTAKMDHVFNSFATAETLDEMVGVTIDFFQRHDD